MYIFKKVLFFAYWPGELHTAIFIYEEIFWITEIFIHKDVLVLPSRRAAVYAT